MSEETPTLDRYATMRNTQATRAEKGQRAKFASRGNSGFARDTQILFNHELNPMKDVDTALASISSVKTTFNSTEVVGNENPDFEFNVPLTYDAAVDMLDSTLDEPDKPNKKGPNLVIPKIDENGSVTVTLGEDAESTDAGFGTNGGQRGFGTKTNTEGSVVIGRYLNRRDSEDSDGIRIGEYIDRDDYDWSSLD